MTKVTSEQKKSVSQKLLEFQKKGLEQYAKYLDQQLKLHCKGELKKHYKKYIEDQIVMNNAKIKKLEAKL